MGGGGVMRAAVKVVGTGVANAGIRRGISGGTPPVEQSMRNASSPVSAIMSSKASGGEVAAGMQRPAWEVDEWELAGGVEEEMVVDSAEPVARVVFWGAPPSLQEAKAATCELKDALQKVYPSSPNLGTGSSLGGSQLSGHSLTNSDFLETNGCISCDPNRAPVPKYAMQAFSLLNESPKIQFGKTKPFRNCSSHRIQIRNMLQIMSLLEILTLRMQPYLQRSSQNYLMMKVKLETLKLGSRMSSITLSLLWLT
ncbi:hypothetical protein H0E87_021040 [Populus deltoides]|uniref:Uncharacterized protein n=1 Tax=Populus deltoides TaxID=3696 RepID=A0A8T2XP33_POPDE|nr:hypothetical protein H0E87_021040 [Populus deltoides]